MTYYGLNEPPRNIAARIAKLKTREERRAALETVPPELRGIVKTHVTNALLIAWHWRARIAAEPFLPVPECVRILLKELGI